MSSTDYDPSAIGEKHDRGGGDNALIDPGPDPRTVQGETAARHALRVSKPAPITAPKKPRKG